MKKIPEKVKWDNPYSSNSYEIVFTRHDIGLLSPSLLHIYSRGSLTIEYGNVPPKDEKYFWYHSGIYVSPREWEARTSQQDSRNDILIRFGYKGRADIDNFEKDTKHWWEFWK